MGDHIYSRITKTIAINYTTWDENSIEKRQDELFVHEKKYTNNFRGMVFRNVSISERS